MCMRHADGAGKGTQPLPPRCRLLPAAAAAAAGGRFTQFITIHLPSAALEAVSAMWYSNDSRMHCNGLKSVG